MKNLLLQFMKLDHHYYSKSPILCQAVLPFLPEFSQRPEKDVAFFM